MFIKQNKSDILFRNLDKLISDGKLDSKRIVLFGLNISSYATKRYLEEKNYSVLAYIDNSENKVLDTQEYLLQILPRHISTADYRTIANSIISAYKPEELLMPFQDDYVILISSKYYPSMYQQLNKMGYQENVHVFKTVDFQEIDSILEMEDDIKGLTVMEPEAIRKKQLELVAYVVDVCKRHDLKIFMGGGTLLGAVRHGGYIPWDDDIDLILPMPDYKRLIEIVQEEDRYDIYNVYTNTKCSNFYTRVIDRDTIIKRWSYPTLSTGGVDIDVFPLSGLPERLDETKEFYNRLRRLYTMYTNSFLSFSDEEEEPELLSFRGNLRESIMEMLERYDFYESKTAAYLLSKYWEKDLMPRNIYDDTVFLKFEDMMLPAPSGYDVYLEYLFGDYMKLPNEKDRYAPHNYRAFYL